VMLRLVGMGSEWCLGVCGCVLGVLASAAHPLWILLAAPNWCLLGSCHCLLVSSGSCQLLLSWALRERCVLGCVRLWALFCKRPVLFCNPWRNKYALLLPSTGRTDLIQQTNNGGWTRRSSASPQQEGCSTLHAAS
jgi:hypothetical protein